MDNYFLRIHRKNFSNGFFFSIFSVKPFFNKEPSDVTVLAGQTVKFYCSVGGDPQPQILWRKDDGNMPVGRADIEENEKSLLIKNVIPADEGIYICEAHNSVGQITAKAQLVVNCEYNLLHFLMGVSFIHYLF